jgi:hypothetical protein
MTIDEQINQAPFPPGAWLVLEPGDPVRYGDRWFGRLTERWYECLCRAGFVGPDELFIRKVN